MKNSIINKIRQQKSGTAKYFFAVVALLSGLNLFAQQARPASEDGSLWLFSNGLFLVLLSVVILLMIIILVLGGVLKNVAHFATERKTKNGNKAAGVITFILFISAANNSSAQAVAASTSSANDYMGLGLGMFVLMTTIIGLEIIIIAVLINTIQLFVRKEEVAKEDAVVKKEEPSFLEKLNASIPIEKEADILLDHNYDGIQELDNDLPPWWKYGFYLTIVFAVVYLIHYHVIKTGDLQVAEYNKAMEAGRIAKEEYQKMDANNVTESNIKMLTDKAQIEEGGNIFKENCAVCHGKLGEGNVGPNLTDEYWLHGGAIRDIFKTIKGGYPDKGMKSWEADFTPLKINELASYIKTLKGTNPPNQKTPQGDMYKEEGTMQSDSTKMDSTKVMATAIDSVKAGVKK